MGTTYFVRCTFYILLSIGFVLNSCDASPPRVKHVPINCNSNMCITREIMDEGAFGSSFTSYAIKIGRHIQKIKIQHFKILDSLYGKIRIQSLPFLTT